MHRIICGICLHSNFLTLDWGLITIESCMNHLWDLFKNDSFLSQNSSKKHKLWLFSAILVLFWTNFLRITVGSHGMIITPMFLYSLESWEHEEYFKLLKSWKRFQKTQVMMSFLSNFALFQMDLLQITVGSHGMIVTPKFLYSLESWDHEEYFKLLQTSNRFQKTQVMTIWKLP